MAPCSAYTRAMEIAVPARATNSRANTSSAAAKPAEERSRISAPAGRP
ncbi:hypothetical protein ACNF49_37015 [Actinomadura sp. ATCC 39365]